MNSSEPLNGGQASSGFFGIAPYTSEESKQFSSLWQMKDKGMIDHLIVSINGSKKFTYFSVKFGGYDICAIRKKDHLTVLQTKNGTSLLLPVQDFVVNMQVIDHPEGQYAELGLNNTFTFVPKDLFQGVINVVERIFKADGVACTIVDGCFIDKPRDQIQVQDANLSFILHSNTTAITIHLPISGSSLVCGVDMQGNPGTGCQIPLASQDLHPNVWYISN